MARATARDFAETQDARVRAYEFFAASLPDRARGLNRLGFLREVVRLTATGADWTAHFGVIAANREDTRKAAEQAKVPRQSHQGRSDHACAEALTMNASDKARPIVSHQLGEDATDIDSGSPAESVFRRGA